MIKFDRNYRIVFEIGKREDLSVYIPLDEVTVSYPFTLHLNIQSQLGGSTSQGNFQIYNLSPEIRALLWKDNFDGNKYIIMSFYAGYGDDLVLCYKSDVLQCYSYRQGGSTEYITDIQCGTGAYLQEFGIANSTYVENSKMPSVLESLLENVPMYKVGYVTPNIPPLKKDRTYMGKTFDLISREYAGYDVYVDKGELNILDKNDVIEGYLPVITAESGLLGSPKRAELYLNCETIFEPRLVLAQAAEIFADSLPFVNNIYKIMGLSHKGTISPVECGKLTTTFSAFLGPASFNTVKKAAESSYKGTATQGKWAKPTTQGYISSPFGARISPTPTASKNHKGIDIGVPAETPILAPADGLITTAEMQGGYGNVIYMDNGTTEDGIKITSRYAHLSRFAVRPSQTVTTGTIIGYAGSTGVSTGPHLHFEIRENGTPINPIRYIGNY